MPTEPAQAPAAGEKFAAWLERVRDTLGDRLLELGQKKAAAPEEIAYNVVYTGRMTLPEAQAITNLAGFFKMGNDNVRRLLQAGRVLKTYPDKMPADKLARLLTRAGAECRVELEKPDHQDEPTGVQKLAFRIKATPIPVLRLPDHRQFGRREWGALGGTGASLLALALWLVLKAPVIEGETLADYEASIERLVAHAEPAQGPAIRKAVALLTETSRRAQEDSSTTDPLTAARLAYAPVEGMSAQELIDIAEARLEKQRNAYRDSLAEADQKIAEINRELAAIAPDNIPVLSKIEITQAAFGWPAGARSPSIAFHLRNGSDETLMHVYLQGYLHDAQGRQVLTSAVTYGVANGIPPGGTSTASLPTQTDSPFANPALRGRTDLVFSLRVANAENLQGKPLGTDYRPLEFDRYRHEQWKLKTQAELDAIRL